MTSLIHPKVFAEIQNKNSEATIFRSIGAEKEGFKGGGT